LKAKEKILVQSQSSAGIKNRPAIVAEEIQNHILNDLSGVLRKKITFEKM